MKGNIFSPSTLIEGIPYPVNRGYPFPGQDGGGGPPSYWQGVPPSKVRMGVSLSYWWGTPRGYPPHWQDVGTTSIKVPGQVPPSYQWGYPLMAGWGTPHPGQTPDQDGGTPNQNSITCTCYVASSMPLSFTQEDFLVLPVCLKLLTGFTRISFMVNAHSERRAPLSLPTMNKSGHLLESNDLSCYISA